MDILQRGSKSLPLHIFLLQDTTPRCFGHIRNPSAFKHFFTVLVWRGLWRSSLLIRLIVRRYTGDSFRDFILSYCPLQKSGLFTVRWSRPIDFAISKVDRFLCIGSSLIIFYFSGSVKAPFLPILHRKLYDGWCNNFLNGRRLTASAHIRLKYICSCNSVSK